MEQYFCWRICEPITSFRTPWLASYFVKASSQYDTSTASVTEHREHHGRKHFFTSWILLLKSNFLTFWLVGYWLTLMTQLWSWFESTLASNCEPTLGVVDVYNLYQCHYERVPCYVHLPRKKVLGVLSTVNREIFVGEIFSWGKSTTKIKRTKILYDQKLQQRIFMKHITRGSVAHLHV